MSRCICYLRGGIRFEKSELEFVLKDVGSRGCKLRVITLVSPSWDLNVREFRKKIV